VDVAVVSYRSAVDLPGLLASVARQEGVSAPPRVLLADNAPGDGSAGAAEAAAREAGLPLEVIPDPRNPGFGAAANRAVARASTEWVLLVNPDGELAPSCLRELLAVARERPGAALVEARQSPFEHPKVYDPATLETPWCSAAAVLLRRGPFAACGGFDASMFLYAEDVDLSWRLRDGGHRLYYAPRAVFHHRNGERVLHGSRLQFRWSVLHNLHLRWKHGGPRELVGGYARFLRLGLRSLRDPARLRDLAWVLPRHLAGIPRALGSRRRPPGRRAARFHDWDYAHERPGAGHPYRAPQGSPSVSIVVRTRRRPGYLREALASLAGQTWPRLEAVVVEDGSSEGEAVAREFEGRIPLRYLRAPEGSGRCRAGNLGARAATGELLGFLDDDDVLYADHVETLVAGLEEHRARVAFSLGIYARQRVLAEDPLRHEVLDRIQVFDEPYDREALLHHNFIPFCCALFRRDLFLGSGGLDEGLDVLEDWDLWIRLAAAAGPFARVPKGTCEYRARWGGPGDARRKRERQAAIDAAYPRVRAKHGLPPLPSPNSWRYGVARLRERIEAGKRLLRRAFP